MATLRDPSKIFFQADHVRRSIIAAYWAVIIIALPLWWHTTSIERLSLPSSRAVEQAHNLQLPVRIGIQAGADIVQLQKSLDAVILQAPQCWKGLSLEIYEKEIQRADVRGSRSSQFWANGPVDESYTVQDSEEVAIYGRHLLFPTASITSLTNTLGALIAPTISGHRVAPYSPRYRLSFTLLNEDAAAGDAFLDWDITTAISRHIQPVLDQLNVLHNFTIESQVHLHAPLAFIPRSIGDGFGIDPEDLTVFVNSAEWSLSSSASNDPVLHFVIFIPSVARRPLHILDHSGETSRSTSFLLPQWGGIVIFNPDSLSQGPKLALSTLDASFAAFSEHLLSLLGMPSLPSNLVPSNRFTDWQLDALLRYRTLNNLQGSQDTLQSIMSLVDQIENMPVGQDVRGDFQGALMALEAIFETSKASLVDTFRLSARAFTLSSRAFFNPGMLALLYFPAEHKTAVYTPMFASAVIPLIVAALKEFSSWKRQRNAKASEEKTQGAAAEKAI